MASLAGSSHFTWLPRARAGIRWGRSTAPDSSWCGRWRTFRPSGAISTTANAESGSAWMRARDHGSAAARPGTRTIARASAPVARVITDHLHPQNREPPADRNAEKTIRRETSGPHVPHLHTTLTD